MNIIKINIIFITCIIITNCQAMEYYEPPKQENYATQSKEAVSKSTSKNPPENIKSESQQAKTSTNSAAKENTSETTSSKKNEKSTVEKSASFESSQSSKTKKTSDGSLDLNSETNTSHNSKPIETTPNYGTFDFKNIEKTSAPVEVNELLIENENLSEKFKAEMLDERIEELLTKTLKLPEMEHHSLAEIIASCIQDLLFHILGLSKSMQNQKPITTFKDELEFLAEQIENYNDVTVYTSIAQMLEFIQYMNNFLKESHLVPLSSNVVASIDASYAIATTTSNIFKGQNAILDVKLVPTEVTQMFQAPIDNNVQLTKINNSKSMIHAVYDKGGSMDLIQTSWQNFMMSKYTGTKNDRYYAAFMTFLLIFQDSILATSCILNETSEEFQATSQLQMNSIAQPVISGPATNVNSSFNMAVSSD